MTPDAKTPESNVSAFNRFNSDKMDREARDEILKSIPAPATIQRWRVSMGMYRSVLAEIMGYTADHILKIEKGRYPLNENFLTNLRDTVMRIEAGLDHVPPSVRHYPRPAEKHLDRYISIRKLAETKGEWRECPECKNTKWFSTIKMKYCSKRCKDRVWRRRKKTGEPILAGREPSSPSVFVVCPNCQNKFPARGNYANISEFGRSQDSNNTNGKAAHDPARQMET